VVILHKERREAGFSLIELIVTATVLAVAAISLVTVFLTVGALNRRTRSMTLATQAAQKRVEIYRNQAFSTLALGTVDFTSELPASLGAPKSATATISDADPNSDPPNPIDLKRVDIDISYTDKGVTKKVQVSTLVAKRGINR
jgi:prepilin-type N-terminal cleavage/methylation domain-containing protein